MGHFHSAHFLARPLPWFDLHECVLSCPLCLVVSYAFTSIIFKPLVEGFHQLHFKRCRRLWFLLNLVIFVVTQAVFTEYSGESSSASIMEARLAKFELLGAGGGDERIRSEYPFGPCWGSEDRSNQEW